MTDIEQLISYIRKFGLYTGEEFTLASGEKSIYYVDVKKIALAGSMHRLLAKLLWNKIKEEYGTVDVVAGVVLGGCHLASITAMHAAFNLTPIDVIYVRKHAKNHGTSDLLEYPELKKESRIVLIEDVVTTGGSVIAAAEILETAGLQVSGVIAVADRRKDKVPYLHGSGIIQWPFVSLLNFEQLL